MKILIVDDIATSRKVLRVILEAEGHALLEAADGVEALQILSRDKVDAVVSDILMPRMDGYRLCHEIRNDEHLRDLPIIIYTSTYTAPSDEKLAQDLGADRFLIKPSPVGVILAALHDAVGLQHTAPRPNSLHQVEVLKEYSDRLVAKLEDKNIELEERLRLNSLSMDVTTALMHGNTVREVLQRCSEVLVQHLDAALAGIWTHNEPQKILELQASAGMYRHTDGPDRRVPVGQLNIGLIAAERKPYLTNSVIGDPRIPDQELVRREGLAAFAGYPLIVGDRLLGVLAIFARAQLSTATLDKLGSIANAVAMGVGRKIAEAELDAANDRLRRLLDSSPAVLYNWKIEGRSIIPTFVSDNMERLLGFTVSGSMSYDWWLKSLHPEDRDRMLATLANGIREGGFTAEYRIRHSDGTYRWILDSNRVLRDAGSEPQELAGVWTDISEHKHEQELNRRLENNAAVAEAASRAKSALLSTMSHEIRTPMNAILGYAKLISRDPALGAETKKHLEIIEGNSEHLLELISDIVDMSKIEAGRMELHPRYSTSPGFWRISQPCFACGRRRRRRDSKWRSMRKPYRMR